MKLSTTISKVVTVEAIESLVEMVPQGSCTSNGSAASLTSGLGLVKLVQPLPVVSKLRILVSQANLQLTPSVFKPFHGTFSVRLALRKCVR